MTSVKEPRLVTHMNSKYAAHIAYTEQTIQKVKVATGITLAYTIQEDPTQGSADEEETRIVLIMGYGYRKEEWAPVVDDLLTQWKSLGFASKLKVLTFDNRGVGDSDSPWGKYSTKTMAKDTLALLDHIGWSKAHIVGISMGGMISQELALRAPERVQSLSLTVTSRGKFSPDTSTFPAIWTTKTSSDAAKIIDAMMSFLYPKEFLDSKVNDSLTAREMLQKYHTGVSVRLNNPTTAGALGQSAALVLHYVSDTRLKEIRDAGFPILIIGARQDLCIDVSHTVHFQNILKGEHVHSVIFEDCGHGVFLQQLEAYSKEIIDVVRRAK